MPSSTQEPLQRYMDSTKQFKESLTAEQLFLYNTMLNARVQVQRANKKDVTSTTNTPSQPPVNNNNQPPVPVQQNVNVSTISPSDIDALKREMSTQTQKDIGTIRDVIKETIKDVIEELPNIQFEVKNTHIVNDGTTDDLTLPTLKSSNRQHYLLPLVVKALQARCHIWLVGPTGSGKSTLAANAAGELNLPHGALSVCGQTTKTDLLGYIDAMGVYRSTCYRQAYEHGGVFCLDEIDNGNANVLAVLNSSLASEVTTFPDGVVQRHKDFVVIACANTYGQGSTDGYVGRVQVDAATLDRFFFIEMPYDDGLEASIAGVETDSTEWDKDGSYVPSVDEWFEVVKHTRHSVQKHKVKSIISPRATYMGISLIAQQVPLQFLKKGLLYKSMSTDVIGKIRRS